MVKADAYGHGLDAAMRGLAEADGLALVEWDGAFEKAGFDDFLLVTGALTGRQEAGGLQAA